MQKQFHFKQFSLAQVRSLNVKTFLLLTIQISMCTKFSSIWPIDRILLGANTTSRVDRGAMAMKEHSAFPKAPALLEPHNQIV